MGNGSTSSNMTSEFNFPPDTDVSIPSQPPPPPPLHRFSGARAQVPETPGQVVCLSFFFTITEFKTTGLRESAGRVLSFNYACLTWTICNKLLIVIHFKWYESYSKCQTHKSLMYFPIIKYIAPICVSKSTTVRMQSCDLYFQNCAL